LRGPRTCVCVGGPADRHGRGCVECEPEASRLLSRHDRVLERTVPRRAPRGTARSAQQGAHLAVALPRVGRQSTGGHGPEGGGDPLRRSEPRAERQPDRDRTRLRGDPARVGTRRRGVHEVRDRGQPEDDVPRDFPRDREEVPDPGAREGPRRSGRQHAGSGRQVVRRGEGCRASAAGSSAASRECWVTARHMRTFGPLRRVSQFSRSCQTRGRRDGPPWPIAAHCLARTLGRRPRRCGRSIPSRGGFGKHSRHCK